MGDLPAITDAMERRVRFELLYSVHAPAVKAYILRRAAPAVADDLVAEVFVVCWRRFDELPADPLPWMLGVARRVLSTQRRGERRGAALQRRLTESGGAPTAFDTSSAFDAPSTFDAPSHFGAPTAHSNASATLRKALEQLSEPDRELLLLIAWEGLSPTQAATAMGLKPATVRVRLHRARRRLARALTREGDEPLACSPLAMEVSP